MMNPKYFLLLLILPFVFWGGCEDKKAAPDCTALAIASTDAATAYTEALMTEPTGDHSALCDANVAAYQAGLDASCDGFDQAGVDVMQDACDGTGGDGDGGDGSGGDCTELATEAAEALATYVMAALEGPATPECEAANSAVQAVIDGGCDIVDEDPANGTGDLEDSQGDLPCAGDGDGGDGGDGDDGEDYGDGECTSDADCVDHYGPGWTCEGEDWMTSCTEGEGGCTSDADCQEGEFCLEGECMI